MIRVGRVGHLPQIFARGHIHARYASTMPARYGKLVVLGSGWGAFKLITSLDQKNYDVTVISPRNHFRFTPLLAGAAVGVWQCNRHCDTEIQGPLSSGPSWNR